VTRSARVASAIALTSALLALDARAEGTRVTLVQPRNASALAIEATTRLAAELRAAGFDVRTVTSSGGDAREEVERVEGSFATIAIVPTKRGAVADVWIADRVTKKTVVRRVDVQDPKRDSAASDLAIRSVELLRASLLEIRQRGPAAPALPAPIVRFADPAPKDAAPAGSPPAPNSTRAAPDLARSPPISTHPAPDLTRAAPVSTHPAPAGSHPAPAGSHPAPAGSHPAPARSHAPPSPRFHASVEAAAALIASTEGGASPRPLIRLAIALPRSISVRLAIAPSVAASALTARHGTVAFRQTLASLDVAYTFLASSTTVRPLVALGGGVFSLEVAGSADPGYVSLRGAKASGFVSAGAGVEVRLTQGLRMLASVSVLALLPPPTVSALGEPLARLGRPAFLPSIGLVADLR
jgi:hypothetical protein